MRFTRKAALSLAASTLIAASATSAYAAELRGMITAHEGSTIVVKSGGSETPIELTHGTQIRGTGGALGMRNDAYPPGDLIRGLQVVVTTDGPPGHLIATKVTFKTSDLKVAQQIEAGISATEKRVAENADRIDNVADLKPVDRTNVLFATGSSTMTAQGKHDLQQLVAKANGIKGYRLIVVGRADKTGNAAANERLSERRAQVVTNYLMRSLAVLPGRILPTAAAGSADIAQDPNPPRNAQEARRVTVTIAVSKSSRQ